MELQIQQPPILLSDLLILVYFVILIGAIIFLVASARKSSRNLEAEINSLESILDTATTRSEIIEVLDKLSAIRNSVSCTTYQKIRISYLKGIIDTKIKSL